MLAQGFKVLGYNVKLLVNRKDIIHRPESRYPQWFKAYPDWVFDVSDVTEEDIASRSAKLNSIIHLMTDRVDLVILNDTGPALSGYLRSPHIVLLTGSDLAYYANYDSIIMRTSMWDPEFKRSPSGRSQLSRYVDLVTRQRDGILSAEIVCYGHRGLVTTGDILLDQIGVVDRRRLMLYMSNTIDLCYTPPPRNSHLTIFSGSRIVFSIDSNPALSQIDFKGFDILIAGFSQYLKRGGQGILKLVRKGQDVDMADQLIVESKVEKHIHWLDELSLFSFYKELTTSDLVCDQFGSSFPGMVTTDSYALGRPVMANFRNEIFCQRFAEPLPGFNDIMPEMIADRLVGFDQNRDSLEVTGRLSRVYAERYLSPMKMADELIGKL